MDRTPVQSSDIASIGYEVATNTLEIEFHDGGIYQYYDVPQYEHEALMSAESHGKYFNANIKKVYRYSRVG